MDSPRTMLFTVAVGLPLVAGCPDPTQIVVAQIHSNSGRLAKRNGTPESGFQTTHAARWCVGFVIFVSFFVVTAYQFE